MACQKLIGTVRAQLVSDPKLTDAVRAQLVSDPKLTDAVRAQLVSDPKLTADIQSRMQFQEGLKDLKHLVPTFVALLISMGGLLFFIVEWTQAPLGELSTLQNGVEHAGSVKDLLSGASWGVVASAVGLAVGAYLGLLHKSVMGAIGRGITLGAAVATIVAAALVAVASALG